MDNLYLVIYSKMDTDERKQGVCKLNRLKALLEDRRYTVWQATWVNPDVDHIAGINRIQ